MKIKKVEIQAFRAYNHCIDGTFDFHDLNGEVANFVSIYAPNGFGKTSFYDAIEWAFTNNIYRYSRNTSINKDYAQDEKQLKFELLGSKSPQYILRNKYSPNNLDSFVNIHLSSSDIILSRKVPKVPRIDSTDFSFDEKQTTNAYFRNVILSQDNIDEFLKEYLPELRYRKFIDFFGDKETDLCYSNILQLIKANENKIANYEKEIKNLEEQIPLISDDEILLKINTKIEKLNQIGELISLINSDYSDSDFIDFSNFISKRKLFINDSISQESNDVEFLEKQESELEKYSYIKVRYEDQRIYYFRQVEIKIKFDELTKMKSDLVVKKESIEILYKERGGVNEIITLLPTYTDLKAYILREKGILEDNNINLNSKNAALVNLKDSISRLRSTSDSLLRLIFEDEIRVSEFNNLENSLLQNTSTIDELTKSSQANNNKLNDINKDLTDLNSIEISTEFEIGQLENEEIPNSVKDDTQLVESVNEISAQRAIISEYSGKLSIINKEINDYQGFNNEVNLLLSKASSLIEATRLTACPVCGFEYNEFDKLINQIQLNKIIETKMKELIINKSQIERIISENNRNVVDLFSFILKIKNKDLIELKDKASELRQNKLTLSNELDLINKKLFDAESTRKDLFLKTDGNSFDEYKGKVLDRLNFNRLQKLENENELKSKYEAQTQIVSEIETFKNINIGIESRINNIEGSRDFLIVNTFLDRNNFGFTESNEQLSFLLQSIQSKISVLNSEISSLESKINDLVEELSYYNENIVASEINEILTILESLSAEIRLFEKFITTHLGVEYLDDPIENIKERLFILIKSKKDVIETYKNLNSEYTIIDSYKDNIIPFLKKKSIQNAILYFREKIYFQKNKVGRYLYEEKERLSSYINKQVESFFYEDLINLLYCKIDPHPEYKKIVFKCDFSSDKPRLNVFVHGEGKDFLIPNLYFSTAQLNILSLSIFLAKALNTKDDHGNSVDCIFIDDPVQSMDSINILSTIDLIRSITFNLNKQVILATHDENFHNLLKMKMPPTTFKSKFIELEAFGKVKV